MPRALPELTRKQIQRAWKTTAQSKRAIALQFGVSEATVKRLTHGLAKDGVVAQQAVVDAAIANGAEVRIDGLSLNQHVNDTIAALAAELPNVPAKSKEGVAGALLRYLEFQYKLETFEELVDRLLGHPDFDPQRFVDLLKHRYANHPSAGA
jgi:DNA-binding MurR/RpiR family transcriptional regulator